MPIGKLARTAGRRPAVLAGAGALLLAVALAGAYAFRLGPFGTATPTVAGPAPTFVEDTAGSGVAFTYDGPFQFAVGGGIAVFDCDDDALPELYVAGGEGAAGLFHNDTTPGGPLRFSRLPATETDLAAVNGAYPVDVDSDGRADLVSLRAGENVALRGLGACRFERANEAWGLRSGIQQSEAFAATWEAGATWPTVAIGNYVDLAGDPAAWTCPPNELIRPAARGGGFGPAQLLEPGFCSLSALFSDWDGSGRADLRISNDREYYPADAGEEQLWRIEPGAAPRLYGVDDGWVRVQVEGMGIASYDVTGDGLPEVYLTSQNASKLQALAVVASPGTTQPSYRDIGLRHRVNVEHPFTGADMDLPSTAWHPEFDDVNDDGFIDLFVSKGNVTSQPDFALEDPSNLLLGQPDGTFLEAADAAGILNMDRGRGAALADLNLDGRLDLVLVNYQGPLRLWRNVGGSGDDGGGWLGIRLRQPPPNVDAVGAIIEVRAGDRTYRREVVVGGGHGGGELGPIHFGLGPADGADVRVRWPGGEQGPWQRVPADAYYAFERGMEPRRVAE
jgi:hypothetical protein